MVNIEIQGYERKNINIITDNNDNYNWWEKVLKIRQEQQKDGITNLNRTTATK